MNPTIYLSKLFKACLDCRTGERVFSAAMSVCFFLVISTFWILKPLKKTAFIGQFDEAGVNLLSWHLSASEAELVAKILNMVVAFAAVVAFTWLARRFRRQQLVHIFSIFFIAGFMAYSLILGRPSDATVWSFYLFGDLFSTLMVATFFAFLNDSVSPDQAKRLYGIVGLGGVVGGVAGSTFVGVWVDAVTPAGWLWVCVGVTLGIMSAAEIAGRSAPPAIAVEPVTTTAPEPGGTAFAGAQLVFRSKYLLSIVAIVGLYEVASTITDFMFTSTVTHHLSGPDIGRQFSRVFALTNWVSMLVQFFLTSLIMTRVGMGAALMVLPAALVTGSAAFLVLPILWTGSLLNTADNGFSYSINQSAKEALYVPVPRHEKYQAKAFIDIFVQRVAKALAVVVSLVVSSTLTDFDSVRWLALVNVVIVAAWFGAARYAGRAFQPKCDEAVA
ncbi:MAG: NTP/NDP exchange transporter [Vicinamibacterales bacterium]